MGLSKWVAGANKTTWISLLPALHEIQLWGSPWRCSWQWRRVSSPLQENRVFALLSFHSLHQAVFISGWCMSRWVQRRGQNPSLWKSLLNEPGVDLYLPELQGVKKTKKKKKKVSSIGSWEPSPPRQHVTRAVRNVFSPRTWQDTVRPGQARSLLFGHALGKERIPVSDKQARGQGASPPPPPGSWALIRGEGERLDPGVWAGHWRWKDLTLPGLLLQRVAGTASVPRQEPRLTRVTNPGLHEAMKLTFISLCHQRPVRSNFRAGSHLFNNLEHGAKAKTQQQLCYPQTFRQRHLPNFTWRCCSLRNSYASVGNTAQQCFLTFLIPKAMHRLEKKNQERSCVVLANLLFLRSQMQLMLNFRS